MENYNLSDTITAIATPVGESGIGIVRISGKDALKIADRIFVSKNGKKPSRFRTYTVHYGHIIDNRTKIIDEVILTVMRAPRSYTKEDIVEINCHSGILALRGVLDLVLENGARLAQPGEFTKRAFLNGRIDLAQAEAVLDIISAKTSSALKIGIEQLKGRLSYEINKIRKALLDILSILEANIDFPEEEINPVNIENIHRELENVQRELKKLLDSSNKGRILREGIRAVICGKPNVGKSSLLNALLKQERSIVTPIAGTTRDTIEEIIDIKGIPVRIVDTAGILEPQDLIAKKAVERSKRYIGLADLVILLFDGSRKITKEDEFLMHKLKKKTTIATINKVDLRQKIEKKKILNRFKNVIEISCKNNTNINLLEDTIASLVYNGELRSLESLMVSNLRHIQEIKEAQRHILESLNSLKNELSLEFIAEDIKLGLLSLDTLLGRRFSEDLLDKIFSDFCIGK
jgi:tRNA modification GTPase